MKNLIILLAITLTVTFVQADTNKVEIALNNSLEENATLIKHQAFTQNVNLNLYESGLMENSGHLSSYYSEKHLSSPLLANFLGIFGEIARHFHESIMECWSISRIFAMPSFSN